MVQSFSNCLRIKAIPARLLNSTWNSEPGAAYQKRKAVQRCITNKNVVESECSHVGAVSFFTYCFSDLSLCPSPSASATGTMGHWFFFLAYVDNIKQLQPRLWNPVLVFHGFPPPPRPRPLDVKKRSASDMQKPNQTNWHDENVSIYITVHIHVHVHIHIHIYIYTSFYIIIKNIHMITGGVDNKRQQRYTMCPPSCSLNAPRGGL